MALIRPNLYYYSAITLYRCPQHRAEHFAMSDENLQPVLRCGKCNKPFDKRESL